MLSADLVLVNTNKMPKPTMNLGIGSFQKVEKNYLTISDVALDVKGIAGGPVPKHIKPIWPFIAFTAFPTLPTEFKKYMASKQQNLLKQYYLLIYFLKITRPLLPPFLD